MSQPEKPHLLIATRNRNKTGQIRLAIGESFEIRDLRDHPEIPDIAETSDTFVGNATLKAVEASLLRPGEFVLADDSGICVDALSGAPGVRSARYAHEQATDKENNALLLQNLQAAGVATPEQRRAHYACCMVIARNGEVLHVTEGRVDGRIGESPRGSGGFGYDPLFIPNGHEKTFAELDDNVKVQFNHRGQALAGAVEFLTKTALRPE